MSVSGIPPPHSPEKLRHFLWLPVKWIRVGHRSVGTVWAASNCNMSCMFIPRYNTMDLQVMKRTVMLQLCCGYSANQCNAHVWRWRHVSVHMKAVNSHRVVVSVAVSRTRGTVLSLRRRRLQITGSSLEWEACYMLIANWKRECYWYVNDNATF